MIDLNTLESSEAPNSSRPVSNLKTLISKKLTRTASELPMNKSLSIFSATMPGAKFINLRRASNDNDNSPGLSSKLNTQTDDNEKSPGPRILKKTMSSTMGNFRQRSTASPESPLAMNSKSSSPNKRRTFASAIRITPTRPFTREARASSRWSPLRGSPLVGSPTNNKSNESVSFAVMKVQEIITDCCRLTQNSPDRAKNKAKEEEEAEQQKSARAFDFWKKDQTFLEERAKMRVELQKYKDANQVKKKKGPNFLEEVEKDNKHEDEEERNNGDNKEANEAGKGNIEQNDDISKFILQKPRTFYVKTLPASVRKQLRLMQGPAQPVSTEEDKPLEKTDKIEPEVPKPVSQKIIGSSPGIKEVSIDLEKTQSTEKRFRSHSKDQVNESVVAKTEEAERVSSPVIIRKTQELPRQATKSFDKSSAKSDHSRKIETSLKKETNMLGETIAKWNEKVEISPKQKVSFLAYKRGDYRKRVVAVHQMYKSATFLKTFTQ